MSPYDNAPFPDLALYFGGCHKTRSAPSLEEVKEAAAAAAAEENDGQAPPAAAANARPRRFFRNPFNIFGRGSQRRAARRAQPLTPAQSPAPDDTPVVSHEDGACPPHGYRNMLAVLEGLDLGATKYRDTPTDVRTDFRTLMRLDAARLPKPLSSRTLETDNLPFVWKVKTVKPIVLSGPTANAKKYRIPAGRELVLKRVSAFALEDFTTELEVYGALQTRAAAAARSQSDKDFFRDHFVHVYGFFTAVPGDRPADITVPIEDGYFIMDAHAKTDLEKTLEDSVKAGQTAAVRLAMAGEVTHQVTRGVAMMHAVGRARSLSPPAANHACDDLLMITAATHVVRSAGRTTTSSRPTCC